MVSLQKNIFMSIIASAKEGIKMLNQVMLVGRLIDIPIMKTTKGGVKVANATLQVEQGFKNGLGAYESDYVTVSLWRGIAEMIIETATPGSMMAVKGRLHSRTFECGDAKVITSIEVIAEHVSLLDKYFNQDK
ncbi:single-stranded DNA-binding protein B [Thomasclavelia cocleata]|uniref:Single-stranded DNA-binding protein n=4 Tax=Thomasclavelia cocleata TaxID=69824 RepID=A0A829ZCX1_9FIRM|nr:single-stranded DNA-binding protein B [Thomasclavelia cocleata]